MQLPAVSPVRDTLCHALSAPRYSTVTVVTVGAPAAQTVTDGKLPVSGIGVSTPTQIGMMNWFPPKFWTWGRSTRSA